MIILLGLKECASKESDRACLGGLRATLKFEYPSVAERNAIPKLSALRAACDFEILRNALATLRLDPPVCREVRWCRPIELDAPVLLS